MRPGVVIHIHRPCSEWVVVEMGDNNWLQDVWGCISHDCKLDLVTIQGNLIGDQYIRDVLQPVVAPHFDNHPLATRPVYMDNDIYCSKFSTGCSPHVLG
jgi:hypothetical protein